MANGAAGRFQHLKRPALEQQVVSSPGGGVSKFSQLGVLPTEQVIVEEVPISAGGAVDKFSGVNILPKPVRPDDFKTEPAAPIPENQEEIDAEIAELEAELATLTPQTPEVIDGQLAGFTPPQAPELPGAEILENPLLKAIQDDVQRRVFAGQASRRRIAPTETAVALQNALMPTALNLGLGQQERQQAQQQQNISNLMRLFGMGGNIAAGQGTVGTTAAGGIGSALEAGGAAQAGGALGRGEAISQGLGGLAQIAGASPMFGAPPAIAPSTGGGLFGTPFQPTTSIPFTA